MNKYTFYSILSLMPLVVSIAISCELYSMRDNQIVWKTFKGKIDSRNNLIISESGVVYTFSHNDIKSSINVNDIHEITIKGWKTLKWVDRAYINNENIFTNECLRRHSKKQEHLVVISLVSWILFFASVYLLEKLLKTRL